MGRPYNTEISAFPETYKWALEADVGEVVATLRRAARLPLMAVGSGGALSAAQFCADWHQLATGRLAKAVTPLETVAAGGALRELGIAVFSAGGRNADIRRAFSLALSAEPPATLVISTDSRSPLVRAARAAGTPAVFAEKGPAGRDGFLATNSLLAFSLIIHRAYAAVLPAASRAALTLPSAWSEFAGDAPALVGSAEDVLWSAQTLIVLHSYTTRAAAVDLESKCTEAGLLQVQLADFRNFAHGRHHWIAKHPDSAVIALVTPEDAPIAGRTLALLPRSVAKATLRIPMSGPVGGLRAIVDVMRLVQGIGCAKGVDPGRPGVPAYGGKLYSLRGINLIRPAASAIRGTGMPIMDDAEQLAIERKLRKPFYVLPEPDQHAWRQAYTTAREALAGRPFRAVVFDYDGTLVDTKDRFSGPRAGVVEALARLLTSGTAVGIATGRGRSAGKELRERLAPSLWERVLMGYYNGGAIAVLAEESQPDRREMVGGALRDALDALSSSSVVTSLAVVTPRIPQITLEPHDPARVEELWDAIQGVLLRCEPTLRLVRSSHSIDVLGRGVSKTMLVDELCQRIGATPGTPVLRVGDRAAWPGNDAELLAGLDGVSVDEVSADPAAAWNFAPAGLRGVAATLVICGLLKSAPGGTLRLTWNGQSTADR
jgi:fructoselysine-6-P-deglycase FrlB-like protein